MTDGSDDYELGHWNARDAFESAWEDRREQPFDPSKWDIDNDEPWVSPDAERIAADAETFEEAMDALSLSLLPSERSWRFVNGRRSQSRALVDIGLSASASAVEAYDQITKLEDMLRSRRDAARRKGDRNTFEACERFRVGLAWSACSIFGSRVGSRLYGVKRRHFPSPSPKSNVKNTLRLKELGIAGCRVCGSIYSLNNTSCTICQEQIVSRYDHIADTCVRHATGITVEMACTNSDATMWAITGAAVLTTQEQAWLHEHWAAKDVPLVVDVLGRHRTSIGDGVATILLRVNRNVHLEELGFSYAGLQDSIHSQKREGIRWRFQKAASLALARGLSCLLACREREVWRLNAQTVHSASTIHEPHRSAVSKGVQSTAWEAEKKPAGQRPSGCPKCTSVFSYRNGQCSTCGYSQHSSNA